jgi:ketosteroid isomerase-like protein
MAPYFGSMAEKELTFEEKVARARAGYEAFNRGELEAVLRLLDPEISWRRRAHHPVPQTFRGHSDVSNAWDDFREQFAEVILEPVQFLDHGEYLVVRVRQQGRGRLSGAPVEGELFHVMRVRGDQLVELRAYSTMEEALKSLHT